MHLCDYLASSYGALAGENSQKERVLKVIVEDFGFSARILNRILSAQERSWGLRILFLLGCLCFCINVSTFSDAERVDLVAHILPGSLMARFDRQGGFVSLRGTILAQNGNPMNDNDVLDILRTSAQQASLRAQDQQVVQQTAQTG